MTEGAATRCLRDRLLLAMPGVVIYKHNDRNTADIPDTSLAWNGPTSWLEFKMLGPEESPHSKHGLKPGQLVQLIKLERATGRAWCVVFSKDSSSIRVFRPTALFGGACPTAADWSRDVYAVHEDVRSKGIAVVPKLDFAVVAGFVRLTHERR